MATSIEKTKLLPSEETTIKRKNTYSILDRIMRVALFQMSASQDGYLEYLAYELRRRQIFNGSCCSSKNRYDPARCLNSQEILIALGGEELSLNPRDKEAVIKGIYFNPLNIKKKIEDLGGRWEKIEHEGLWHFAIKGPNNNTEEWTRFSSTILERMYWKKAHWDHKWIISAENVANTRFIGENKKGVLLIDVTVPWPMHRREIGRFIGFGCHVAAYNPRGIEIDPRSRNKDTGVITEAACYEDVLCVLNALEGHKLSWILRGNCLNAAIAVHIIAQQTEKGVCAFLDNVPKSPREILNGHSRILDFYDKHIKATQSSAGSFLYTNHTQNGFNSMEILKNMELYAESSSRVFFVGTQGDVATPPEKVKEVFDIIQTKLPLKQSTYFEQNLTQFEGGENLTPHMASSIGNPQVRKIFVNFFGMEESQQTDS